MLFFPVFLFQISFCADTMSLQQGEDWRSVRCMCGALSGRCQDHITESGEATVVYRLVKYAIRPVSPSAEYVFHVHGPLGHLLICVSTSDRAGYRSLRSSSKIWQNFHALMRRIGLSFWTRRKNVQGSSYVPLRALHELSISTPVSLIPFPLEKTDVALQAEYAFVLQG